MAKKSKPKNSKGIKNEKKSRASTRPHKKTTSKRISRATPKKQSKRHVNSKVSRYPNSSTRKRSITKRLSNRVRSSSSTARVPIIDREGNQKTIVRITIRFSKKDQFILKSAQEIYDHADFLLIKFLRSYEKLSKAKSKLYLLKIMYYFKLDGRNLYTEFGTPVTHIEDVDDFERLFEMLIDNFAKAFEDYFSRGFMNVKVVGTISQVYKIPKGKKKRDKKAKSTKKSRTKKARVRRR